METFRLYMTYILRALAAVLVAIPISVALHFETWQFTCMFAGIYSALIMASNSEKSR